MSVKFYLLSRQAKNGDCPIVVSICIKGQRLVTSIGYGCNPGNWNKTKMEVRGKNGKGIPAKVINLRIYKIKTAFLNYEIACSESAAQIPHMKKMLRTTIHGRDSGNQEDKILMNQYMDYGIRTRQWADGTIYNNRMMFRHLILYKESDTFNLFRNKREGFINYLRQNRFADTTVKKYDILLHGFLSWCMANGKVPKIENSETVFKTVKNPVVFLSTDELLHVINLPVGDGQGKMAIARDIFVFCCATALRYSDLIRLKKNDIHDGSIHILTKKTDTPVVVELNGISCKILDRYKSFEGDMALPYLDNRSLNGYIKSICRECGINQSITKTYYRAGKRVDISGPKWKFMSIHCGRRTFICHAVSKGIPPQIIMKWTGHSDYKSMKPYIDIVSKDKEEAMKRVFDEIKL